MHIDYSALDIHSVKCVTCVPRHCGSPSIQFSKETILSFLFDYSSNVILSIVKVMQLYLIYLDSICMNFYCF